MSDIIYVGLDVGSTTVKVVVMDAKSNIIKTLYKRHFSDTKNTVCSLLEDVVHEYGDRECSISMTGSGAIGIAKNLGISFIQEVIACKNAVEKYIPSTDVIIELGGEDAKIIYFGKSVEQRMNGTCAGGTGAFLDQMALLMDTDTMGLNELARSYSRIYPIASRCGVFAKTDIQPLLNEGVAREDIAVSIFQAVVNQTISGLACGRPIRGNVAFLGGPLNYLSELRNRFIDTLSLKTDNTILPKDAHLFVAKGAALYAMEQQPVDMKSLKDNIEKLKTCYDRTTNSIPPLFATAKDYKEFKNRHQICNIHTRSISEYKGDAFLGIDAGSTTSKLVLMDTNGDILYKSYKSNEGKPLGSIIDMLKGLYKEIPQGINIRYSGVTGYGEGLIKAALGVDFGEVETVAHYTAAKMFEPNVTSIVDIGGQDMKYISIKNGFIKNIMLNEACSSGCGSFIETFAKSLGISIDEFKDCAIESKNPVDLGSRCTVFMNSKIKQAQKEGYLVGDIAAGLSYSVVKNAIQKVMKIRDTNSLGEYIVVQGGTFYNDAVLRAFELLTNRNVIRPDIAGLMGAYGMAVLAKERCGRNKKSSILELSDLDKLDIKLSHVRCNGCENHCQLTINKFSNGQKYVSGNRCEKGEGIVNSRENIPNIMQYKYKRIFDYTPLEEDNAYRGTIGIPRVLNMYEDYPFWFTLFTTLGFRVILSDKSTRKTYEKGIESMPSESVCYPAKLVHGHIMDLVQRGVKTIFYPCIPYSRKEFADANNKYNCPIVISYSEVIKNNVTDISSIRFINPFLPFNKKHLIDRLLTLEEFSGYNFKRSELKIAVNKAEAEYQRCRKDIQDKGLEVLKYMEQNNVRGIVLAGRPYHIDKEINHGIDTLITSLGLCVLTEDSVSNKTLPKRPLRVVDQWMFHSRLYAAADFVARRDDLELVQLNSFGCGVDAVTTDQVEEILASFGKMYTLIKIDEVNNLGAVKIRLRSLMASMNNRVCDRSIGNYVNNRKVFTKEMKDEYTILLPQMAPIHFEFLEPILKSEGYRVKLLKNCTSNTINKGLKYVNNDACYPSIITTGQFIEALESGEYDKDKVALLMSQTSGGCRATNYIGFIRKALKDAGFENVPVISFSAKQLEKNSGFKISIKLVKKLLVGMIYADLLQRMLYKNRPYERYRGESQKLFDKWIKRVIPLAISGKRSSIQKSIYNIVKEFEMVEWNIGVKKPKVGIVGEILIKYHPFGNNNIIELLEREGAEVVMPDFMGFIKYMSTDAYFAHSMFDKNIVGAIFSKSCIKVMDMFEKDVRNAISKSNKGYLPTCDIWHLANNVKSVLSTGNQSGEGWFLTAEMMEYLENDIPNIVCVQPFACLPNHVVGKGVIKTIRDTYPNANIVAVDYDPGASEINQVNRIKLMMAVARDNL